MKKLTIALGIVWIAFGGVIIHHSRDIVITIIGVAMILLSILILKHSDQ